ncbi:MAG: aspartate aminotransferase family protein [Tepidiformaceae bacterium]
MMEPEAIARAAFVPTSLPFTVTRAEGAYLYTPEGRPVLDAAGGAVVMNIGHGRAEVAEVAARALSELTYVVPPFATPDRVRLVERLTKNWLPEGITRATFVSGGSESVEAAIRLARQHHLAAGRPERWKVIGTDMSYHGISLGALSVGGHANRRRGFEPLLLPFPKVHAPYRLRGADGTDPGDDPAAELEEVILREGPETVAAFIAEPVVGSAAGVLVPPANYWPRLREICDRYEVLLIADEVMSGFGRTGVRFGVDLWDVKPDIMVGGKGLAGGYAPMGGLYASERVVAPMAAAGAELMFYTFSGHPASCAVAGKVLEIMEREELVARAAKMGKVLGARLAALAAHPNVAEVRGVGLLWGVELVKDRRTLERFPASTRLVSRVVGAGLQRGVFFYPGGSGPAQDVVMLGPPFIINEEDIDIMVDVLGEAIDAAVTTVKE